MVKHLISDRRLWLYFLGLFAIGIAGVVSLLRSTPYGLGLISDTVAYVNGAENIAKGNGYTITSGSGGYKPITGFPPLLSILLAPFSFLRLDVLKSARILIAVLFGLDIILTGLLVQRISRSLIFSLMGALLLAVSDILLEVYALLLSEPLFITLMLAAFLLFSFYFDDRRSRWLVLSGLMLGLAALARLPGIWVLGSVILTCFMLETDWLYLFAPSSALAPRRSVSQRLQVFGKSISRPLRESLFILSASLPLILVWVIYTFTLNTGLGNRSLIWHPIPFTTFIEGFKNLLSWMAPKSLIDIQPFWGRLLSLFSLLLLPGLMVYLVWQVRRRFIRSPSETGVNGATAASVSLATHILVYMIFMVLTISVIDASEPLNSRLLSVIYIPLIIIFASSLSWVWRSLSRFNGVSWMGARVLFGAFCLGLVFTSLTDGLAAVEQLSREGLGYANRNIVGSEAIADIRAMPPLSIYSNNSDEILLMTGKPATIIPTPFNPMTTLARPDYMSDVNDLRQRVLQGEALLVLFDMNNKSNAYKYSIYKTLTTGLPLMKDYGNIQIFGKIN